MRNHSSLLWVVLLLDGVFADADAVKSVSVIEGDSVTLYTTVTVQSDDKIVWMFGVDNEIIAKIERGEISINVFSDGRFRDRLELDSKGSLTIKNIQKEHEGLYELDISGVHETSKRFRVTVRGGAKKKLAMVGESINLHTSVTEIKGYDLVLWEFEDQVMAEINIASGLFFLHKASEERFNGRLDLERETGDLIIRSIQTTDSGVYHLNMSSSSHSLQRSINVTVSDQRTPDPGPHTNYEALIVGLVLGIGLPVAFALIFYCYKKNQKTSSNPRAQHDGVNDVSAQLTATT